MLILFLILSYFSRFIYSNCFDDVSRKVPKYYMLEKCYRSKLGVIASADFKSLQSCVRLGLERRGLALNFSPPEAQDGTGKDTCQVLKCAEADGGVTLVKDSRYDYYSIYAKHLPHINSTCIPGTGMFSLLPQRLNYTDAVATCRNMSGVLADILTDSRTDVLAVMLAGAAVDLAYVGVYSKNGSEFTNEHGDTLDCTTYRAWSPGHPKTNRKKYGCVALTKARTWVTVACNKKHLAICELLPSGPYKRGSIFKSRKPNFINGTMVMVSNFTSDTTSINGPK